MEIVLINSEWQEKGLISAEVDIEVSREEERTFKGILVKTPLNNPYSIQIGDYIAVLDTDFGGRLTAEKIDYQNGMLEFTGFAWWQLFEYIYVAETDISDMTAAAALTEIINASQMSYGRVVNIDENFKSLQSVTSGGVLNFADSIRQIEQIFGVKVKLKYSGKYLNFLIVKSADVIKINAEAMNCSIEYNPMIPEVLQLIGDNSKAQYEGQEPIEILSDETKIYPQTILLFDCENQRIIESVSLQNTVHNLSCQANDIDSMIEEAKKYYEDIVNSIFAFSGTNNEEFEAELADVVQIIDYWHNICFCKSISKKIFTFSEGNFNPSITYEMGEINYAY